MWGHQQVVESLVYLLVRNAWTTRREIPTMMFVLRDRNRHHSVSGGSRLTITLQFLEARAREGRAHVDKSIHRIPTDGEHVGLPVYVVLQGLSGCHRDRPPLLEVFRDVRTLGPVIN